ARTNAGANAMKWKFVFAGRIVAAAILFAPAALAQEAQPQKPAPFVAELMLVKADWSQSPAAKEIAADLRQALSSELVSLKLLDELAVSGPGVLFPISAVSIYTTEHYGQVLAWLKTRQLIQQIEQFDRPMQSNSSGIPGSAESDGWLTLNKDSNFFG